MIKQFSFFSFFVDDFLVQNLFLDRGWLSNISMLRFEQTITFLFSTVFEYIFWPLIYNYFTILQK